MEGEVAIPIQNLDIPDQRREHKLVTYKQNYHGNQINILELDHHDSEQAGTEYKLPVNWREQLQTQIEATTGPIAPEYCMPDLERYLFNTNGPLGLFAKALLGGDNSETLMPDDDKSSTKNADSFIAPFYGFIAKTAGRLQRNLIATDTANKAVYWLFSGASIAKHQSAENRRAFTGQGAEFKYEYGNIDPEEYKRHDSNDGRHLVTARGLMQEALRSKIGEITAIWAPKHAERIADYIQRQNDAEARSTLKVEGPPDFKYVSQPDETNKMIFYGRPPLIRSVREYKPVLSPEAYKIDILANEKELDVRTLQEAMSVYLTQIPRNRYEKKFQSRVKRALRRIDKTNEIKSLVNTDRVGWKQVKNEYIY
ncbi:MAG: hypothetical protein UR39_C0006G0007 [Candidatus Woesebacteria bacterium GW2011_GWA1_33_30]|uniref:Uncharacterized protein n=1 Tax=Candidatus Woesebacteria bacterium GW2011_GWA2_33_28 TaxID=1618561 RepID=A0A0F9ZRZ5_9BACT|nr:MAG: hypothetical protein UR38_C0006G0046 [Candidatus Woesebacteria bacterium GW2011_GWA2_33_28]KKP47851.1 MAG: hypothetical protein UR39_C0006G0007 [Candidatus Woesebacteria bacterium GW2011_GWA1_33_30]KKP49294.1 MAG: hypothetical protein UR40_C0007G0007 [Microgenomates group bacterium GW2011_GWC1_33_32]KKP52004.1 MAG: hypothetical protein UR44_C0005G0007 [Candidatus Woesebacteria bacterium GW2011_GWB1_33_38]KKP57516.1 MAG: hypothetical protein UR48_C0015G0007 [Microgenomates group bacteriu